MPIPKKIIKFLKERKVKYEPIEHKKVFTAFDKSQTLKVPQKFIGKTLILKTNREFVFTLIPANKNLCKVKFKKVVNSRRKKEDKKAVKEVNFAKEGWIKKNIKGVKVGAIPPFGVLWKMTTFVDQELLKSSKIIINTGNHKWSIKIKGVDLKKLIPDLVIGSFSKAKN